MAGGPGPGVAAGNLRRGLRPESEPESVVLTPGVIAGLYRALRKGREDAKDEPGAADFYYGEMEMRRHDHRPGKAAGRSRGRGVPWGAGCLLADLWLWSSSMALTWLHSLP